MVYSIVLTNGMHSLIQYSIVVKFVLFQSCHDPWMSCWRLIVQLTNCLKTGKIKCIKSNKKWCSKIMLFKVSFDREGLCRGLKYVKWFSLSCSFTCLKWGLNAFKGHSHWNNMSGITPPPLFSQSFKQYFSNDIYRYGNTFLQQLN